MRFLAQTSRHRAVQLDFLPAFNSVPRHPPMAPVRPEMHGISRRFVRAAGDTVTDAARGKSDSYRSIVQPQRVTSGHPSPPSMLALAVWRRQPPHSPPSRTPPLTRSAVVCAPKRTTGWRRARPSIPKGSKIIIEGRLPRKVRGNFSTRTDRRKIVDVTMAAVTERSWAGLCASAPSDESQADDEMPER